MDQGCRSAGIGYVDPKKWFLERDQETLGPIWEPSIDYDANSGEVVNVLHDGAKRSRQGASGTMAEDREAVNI